MTLSPSRIRALDSAVETSAYELISLIESARTHPGFATLDNVMLRYDRLLTQCAEFGMVSGEVLSDSARGAVNRAEAFYFAFADESKKVSGET